MPTYRKSQWAKSKENWPGGWVFSGREEKHIIQYLKVRLPSGCRGTVSRSSWSMTPLLAHVLHDVSDVTVRIPLHNWVGSSPEAQCHSSLRFRLTLPLPPPTFHDKFNSASILMALVNSNTFVRLCAIFCSCCHCWCFFPLCFCFHWKARALQHRQSRQPRLPPNPPRGPPHCARKLRKVEGFWRIRVLPPGHPRVKVNGTDTCKQMNAFVVAHLNGWRVVENW